MKKIIVWAAMVSLLVSFGMLAACKPRPKSAVPPVATSIGQGSLLTAKGKLLKDKHPDWTDEDCNGIAERSIHAGMTKDQVAEAWGKPFKMTASKGEQGDQEIWEMHEKGNEFLLFDNGVLTMVKQPKTKVP